MGYKKIRREEGKMNWEEEQGCGFFYSFLNFNSLETGVTN